MSIKRITISVPDAVARRIKRAAGSVPVSAWVTDVLEQRLNDADLDSQWQAFCCSDARAGQSRTADPIDAHLVLIARERGWVVLSSDVGDLLAIDPTLTVERI